MSNHHGWSNRSVVRPNDENVDCGSSEHRGHIFTVKLNYRKSIVFFLAIFFLAPCAVFAHGVMGEVGRGGIVVGAKYTTGEPMSYAKVKISAPGAKLPFQSGRTDRNGRFCFFPDKQGEWKVVVDDEMGHRLEVRVPVDKEMKLRLSQQVKKPLDRFISQYERAITGISIILGVTGMILWWRAKKVYLQRNQ